MARPSNSDTKVRKRSGTREDPATSRSAVGRAADGLVVLAHDGSGEVEQRGARVSNRSANRRRCSSRPDAVAAGAEFPVGFLRDGGVGQGAGILGRVDEPEVIASWLPVLRYDVSLVLGLLAVVRTFKSAVNRALGREDCTVWKKGVHCLGEQVLRVGQPRPRRPSLAVSVVNSEETDWAASTDWEVAVTGPTLTLVC